MKLVGVRPRLSWERFSKSHQDRCLKYKPGLLGVHKYLTNKTQLQKERRYMAERKIRPIWTDIKYGSVIVYGILTGRIRGE